MKKVFILLLSLVFLCSCSQNKDEISSQELPQTFIEGDEDINSPDVNFLNYGYAAEYSGSIYYRSNDKGSIYKCLSDGTNTTKLNDVSSGYINILGNWIYYINEDDNYQIYKMSIDGSSNERLIGGAADCLTIYKNKLYYINNYSKNKIYSLNADGTNETPVTQVPCAFSFFIAFDTVYYLNQNDGNKIYSVKTDGTESKKVCDAAAGFLAAIGDKIFFNSLNDQKNIYSINKDGSGTEKIIYDSADSININDGSIYYTKGERLYKVSLGEDKALISENCAAPNFAGNFIFFYSNGKMCRMFKDGSEVQIL